MRSRNRHRRATALVITVGLLAVLAVIGFGFAVLMKLNVDSSNYYMAAARIDMLSHAVVMYAVRDIRYGWTMARPANDPIAGLDVLRSYRAGAAWEPTDNPQAPWYVDPALAGGLYADGSYGRFCYLKNSSYGMVHDVLGDRVGVSYAKVLDSASKINVNDTFNVSRLNAILDYLFDELLINTAVDQSTAGHTVGALSGSTITAYRATLPNSRYSTLEQLRGISGNRMTTRRYDVLKHYLTIYSWPHDPPSVSGFTPYSIEPNATQSLNATQNETRSTINVNTAPYEVLVAILRAVRTQSGTTLTPQEARDVATWIMRKRDPENPEHWTGGFSSAWRTWITSTDYKTWVRLHQIRHWPRALVGSISAWRGYPVGPFDTWNEFFDFIYSLTDPAGSSGNDDPFPTVITTAKAEAIIAAVCPNTFATRVARNCWPMGYTRLKIDRFGEFRLRDISTANATTPEILGKNDLSTTGYTPEFCFSSRGRFEFHTRTFAFVKADIGTVTSHSDYTLVDSSKSWGTGPDQWRGYSVLIYDGEGKGQLRAIVTNTSQTLTVGKWSKRAGATTPLTNNTSRYHILGPGPLLDRMGTGVSVTSTTPHILRDVGTATEPINWENDQWNGYRVAVYRYSGTSIAQESVQERVIIDTLGAAKSLVLSPELDKSLLNGGIGYMILGSYGNVAHDAAAKVYDVIHHTSQKDFAPTNVEPNLCSNIDIGPNPLNAGVPTSAEQDGFITVQDKDTSDAGTFRQNFKNAGLSVDSGGSKVAGAAGGTAKADDIFLGGNAMNDGLYLKADNAGTGDWIAYAPSPQVITSGRDEGGYVSLWFRPDTNCFDGRPHTICRIKGGAEDADLCLQMVGKTLKLTVRQGDVTYGNLAAGLPGGGTGIVSVKYRKAPREHPGVTINVGNTGHAAIHSAWKAGEWHHIAFAWYEYYHGAATNDDGTAATDVKCDHATFIPENPQLDPQPQVAGYLRLWVDGTAVATPGPTVDAFNLVPDASNAVIHFGQPASTAAGTIDGVVARRLTDRTEVISGALAPAIGTLQRYANVASAIYNSPVITLPTGIAGKQVCLGTVTWNAFLPWMAETDDWSHKATGYPVRVQVKLNGVSSKEMPVEGEYRQPLLGGGCPIVRNDDTGQPVPPASGNTIQYVVRLSAWHGETAKGVPRYWQTPVFEDITITYLSPVTFFHWK